MSRQLPDGYNRRHKRLNRVRGPARNHGCVRCPARAQQWAQVHTEDGEDPWADYVPLCRSCHLRYDRVSEAVSAACKGVPKTAAHRAKIAAAHVGYRHTAEARAKMSARAKARTHQRNGKGQFQ